MINNRADGDTNMANGNWVETASNADYLRWTIQLMEGYGAISFLQHLKRAMLGLDGAPDTFQFTADQSSQVHILVLTVLPEHDADAWSDLGARGMS